MNQLAERKDETTTPVAQPHADILETTSGYVLFLDLPRAREKSLEIDLDKERLNIFARVEAEDSNPDYLLRETVPTDFRRTFLLPREIDRGAIRASLQDGVLRVDLPRAAELQPRRIEVRAD